MASTASSSARLVQSSSTSRWRCSIILRAFIVDAVWSNNSVAMRGCHRLADLTRGRSPLWDQVLAWQQPSGLFTDSPSGDVSPLTYHAKFCAMPALQGEISIPARMHWMRWSARAGSSYPMDDHATACSATRPPFLL